MHFFVYINKIVILHNLKNTTYSLCKKQFLNTFKFKKHQKIGNRI